MKRTLIAASALLAATTLTGCDTGPSGNDSLDGVITSCDGPNRIYKLTNYQGIAVVKDDPRCTDSAG